MNLRTSGHSTFPIKVRIEKLRRTKQVPRLTPLRLLMKRKEVGKLVVWIKVVHIYSRICQHRYKDTLSWRSWVTFDCKVGYGQVSGDKATSNHILCTMTIQAAHWWYDYYCICPHCFQTLSSFVKILLQNLSPLLNWGEIIIIL